MDRLPNVVKEFTDKINVSRPQVEGAPDAFNALLEKVYKKCKNDGGDSKTCSIAAFTAAKKDGWHKVGGKWTKKGVQKTLNGN